MKPVRNSELLRRRCSRWTVSANHATVGLANPQTGGHGAVPVGLAFSVRTKGTDRTFGIGGGNALFPAEADGNRTRRGTLVPPLVLKTREPTRRSFALHGRA